MQKFDWERPWYPGALPAGSRRGIKQWAKQNPGKVFWLFVGGVVVITCLGLFL